MPVTLVNKIFKFDSEYKEIFYKLRALSICYYVGDEKEYIKLNSFLQSFVERNKFEVLPEIDNIIKQNIEEFENKIDDDNYTDELDYTEVSYYVKELLKDEKNVPQRFLYGTVFLQSLISLYNSRQYDKVIKIVNRLMEDNQMISYEDEVESRIMYYYCLALARKQSPEFSLKVTYFKDDSYVKYNFLLGYYYRIKGEFAKAERAYKNVLQKSPNHLLTRRELVFIYISNQQYELALEIAKRSYKQNKNNIHYMLAYFDCLIYKKSLDNKEEEDLIEIVDTVRTIYKGIKVNGMYYQILAKYEAFKKNDKQAAIEYINEGIEKNRNNVISYLLKERFDIYEYFSDKTGMEESLEELTTELRRQDVDDTRFNNVLSVRKALLAAHSGKSRTFIQLDMLQNTGLSEDAKEKIMCNVDKVLSGQKIFY